MGNASTGRLRMILIALLRLGWIVNDSMKKKSFSAFMKSHLLLLDDMDFDAKWDGLIAPAIAKKYICGKYSVTSLLFSPFLRNHSLFLKMTYVRTEFLHTCTIVSVHMSRTLTPSCEE